MQKGSLQFFSRFFILLFIFSTSCFDEGYDIQQESPYKELLLSFLEAKRINNTEENIKRINELGDNLNFRRISFYKLNEKQEMFIAEINSLPNLKGEVLKAIFLTSNDGVSDIRILSFSPSGKSLTDYDDLVKDFIENNEHRYNGKASAFTIYQDLIFFNEYEDGKIKINGAVRPTDSKGGGGRTNGCTAWYLITTYYYSDGSTSQTSEYLGTTCDCEQNTTRSSSTMCGGGDGGGSGGGLPGNPQQGDTYVVNLPNGVSRLLEYHCYDYGCIWETILTTLPAVVVTANRQDYYFLPINPFPNYFVLGPDNLLYTYNANWMQWTGAAVQINPCVLAKFLEQNQGFKDKMNDLQSKTNLNYETGYTMKRNTDGTITFNAISGNPNQAGIDFNINSAIDGYIHTHYSGLLSIFSPDDIRALYTLMSSNLMGDPSIFTTGLVTANGTTYVLHIDNVQQFQTFSQNFLSNDGSFNIFSNIYGSLYNINPSNSVQQNEQSFLSMLQATNSGLKLLKGNLGDFNDWNLQSLDQNNNVTTTDCN